MKEATVAYVVSRECLLSLARAMFNHGRGSAAARFDNDFIERCMDSQLQVTPPECVITPTRAQGGG